MVKQLQLSVTLLLMLGNLCRSSWADTPIPPSYHWGRGISWPAAGFNLGGYANFLYQHPEQRTDALKLDELSLLISWSPWQRLRFFSEIELDDWLSTTNSNSFGQAIRGERLYVDWLATETTTLRLGKFLTPIGRWNVIHAAPLIWTTTRPLVTNEQLFSHHLNGAMLTQRIQLNERNLDISIYADHSSQFDVFDSANTGFDTAFGGRVNFELSEAWQIGLSIIDFTYELYPKADRNELFGVDFMWKKDGYEVSAEAIYRDADDRQGHEKGLYLQGIVPLAKHVFAMGRYEYLNGSHQFIATDTHIGVVGLAWRPYVPLVLKAEYRLGIQNELVAPSGFFTSISMFF
ncbi:MAG: hypothetical protein PHU14_00620 [Methylovulum sp.]|nr:hypothetical protein [Methylovulum sp.]